MNFLSGEIRQGKQAVSVQCGATFHAEDVAITHMELAGVLLSVSIPTCGLPFSFNCIEVAPLLDCLILNPVHKTMSKQYPYELLVVKA